MEKEQEASILQPPFLSPGEGPEQSDLQRPPVVYPELPNTLAENCSSIPIKRILGSFSLQAHRGGGPGKPLLLLQGYLALGPYPTLTPSRVS